MAREAARAGGATTQPPERGRAPAKGAARSGKRSFVNHLKKHKKHVNQCIIIIIASSSTHAAVSVVGRRTLIQKQTIRNERRSFVAVTYMFALLMERVFMCAPARFAVATDHIDIDLMRVGSRRLPRKQQTYLCETK